MITGGSIPLDFLLFPNRNLPRKDVAFSFTFEMISARKLEVFTGGVVVFGLIDAGWRVGGVMGGFEDGFGIRFGGGRGGRDASSVEAGL